MKSFNDLADFTRDEVLELLKLAVRLDENPEPAALRASDGLVAGGGGGA